MKQVHHLNPVYSLGLEQGENRLVDYNSSWPLAFSEEGARIQSALGTRALAIEHYGSTSVPGLRAKPIIDEGMGDEGAADHLGHRDVIVILGVACGWDLSQGPDSCRDQRRSRHQHACRDRLQTNVHTLSLMIGYSTTPKLTV
ncbi:MAG: GrpB family protein [Phenylobacterium sp.]|nr:GrpB family protein [Phenylobacterium sp.]